ncbi:ATP-binding protein [Streptomyces chartreusis]|uniref:ATP-binding protein n=1 Tax=Streptomyces chartreusis TaxID=1969 RepID=UPI00386A2FE0|nr:ATP-binding protein [Streptomyces chartreusis]
MTAGAPQLEIRFRGRVIEHLGIDMYQSPVAAIAELVSNAWDADATDVCVSLPANVKDAQAAIVIKDDGEGMTLKQCQERYLNVGCNRRRDRGSETTPLGRPMMGRKGIGKFAGFGIARFVEVDTVSKETGERTVFQLDADQLIGESHGYADSEPLRVDVLTYEKASLERAGDHGTTITLRDLTLKVTPNGGRFRTSMARRFLLLERADQFKVRVNDEPITDDENVEKIEFSFPKAYEEHNLKTPDGVEVDGEWGIEKLPSGQKIRWRFVFYEQPIADDELVGVSVFSHYKLAQRPFLFNLTGGLGGQQGTHYLSGRVEADFLDEQSRDLISTERQRVNWDVDESRPLLEWGQSRVRELLRHWQNLRARSKVDAIRSRVRPFSQRLSKLEPHERRIVDKALTSLAKVPSLTQDQFADLADSTLSAWEGGRLKELIDDLAQAESMDAEKLVRILAESRVMSALHAAEHVKGQLNLITGLEERVKQRDLELQVRNYIAENPWLISPEWETFRVEKGIEGLVDEIAQVAYGGDWDARVDLVLSSGSQLLVIEFMRPGLKVDWDHLNRYERYVTKLRHATVARTSEFKLVSGLLVADKIDQGADVIDKVASLRANGMDATDWAGLLRGARKQWEDYFDILYNRAPEDPRMQQLGDGHGGWQAST